MEIEQAAPLRPGGRLGEEIIPNLSSARVLEEEEEVREVLGTFEAAEEPPEDAPDLSLYSLRPYHHVKILQSPERVDVSRQIQAPQGFTIVHGSASVDESTAVYVLQSRVRPEWTSVDHLDSISHELVILYFDEPTSLLFICSSLRTEGLYEHLAQQFGWCQASSQVVLQEDKPSVARSRTLAAFQYRHAQCKRNPTFRVLPHARRPECRGRHYRARRSAALSPRSLVWFRDKQSGAGHDRA